MAVFRVNLDQCDPRRFFILCWFRKWTTERSGNCINVARVHFYLSALVCQTSGTAIPDRYSNPNMFPWGLWQGCPYTVSQKHPTFGLLRAVVLTQYRRVADGRMDGQTDGIAVASTALAMRALRCVVTTIYQRRTRTQTQLVGQDEPSAEVNNGEKWKLEKCGTGTFSYRKCSATARLMTQTISGLSNVWYSNSPHVSMKPLTTLSLHRVSKNVPPLACCNFDICERILIFFWQ